MTTSIENAKKHLIELMCIEAKKIIKSKTEAKYGICKIGWVDYHAEYDGDIICHEFTSAYIGSDGSIWLVESDSSEAHHNLKMHQVTDIEKLEWILQGLTENN